MKKLTKIILLTLFISVSFVASAQTIENKPKPVAESDLKIDEDTKSSTQINQQSVGDTVFSFIRMIFVLAFVLGLIFITLKIFKKLQVPQSQDTNVIKVHASRLLQTGRTLHVVSIGKQMFFIGSSEGGISVLSEISDTELKDTLFFEEPKSNTKNFSSVFQKLMGFPNKTDSSSSLEKPLDFLSKQKDRLKNLK